jgi:hypothetical protein
MSAQPMKQTGVQTRNHAPMCTSGKKTQTTMDQLQQINNLNQGQSAGYIPRNAQLERIIRHRLWNIKQEYLASSVQSTTCM